MSLSANFYAFPLGNITVHNIFWKDDHFHQNLEQHACIVSTMYVFLNEKLIFFLPFWKFLMRQDQLQMIYCSSCRRGCLSYIGIQYVLICTYMSVRVLFPSFWLLLKFVFHFIIKKKKTFEALKWDFGTNCYRIFIFGRNDNKYQPFRKPFMTSR